VSASLDHHLSPVLDALTFPVHRWQIVTAAEEYGADLRTRTALRKLTQSAYFTREMLLREIAASGGTPRNPLEATARPPRVAPRITSSRGRALIPPRPSDVS
jgi:hypothetical protein